MKGGFKEAAAFEGEYKGLKLTVTIDAQAMLPILHAKGSLRHDITNTATKGGLLRGLKTLEDHLSERIQSVQQERESMIKKVEDAKELLKKTFPYAKEEIEKRARLIEINNCIESPEKQSAMSVDGEIVQAEICR